MIISQEESLEKLTKSAETLAGVSEVVKGDVQELVEQKRTYAELVAKREDSAEESPIVAKQEAPTKSVLKQAMKEANQEDERQGSVIISGIADGFNGGEKKYELDEMFSHMSIRGCPHYASRRRASRRGPSGVVCLDTWAMRRDYSRLQA